MAEPVEKRQSPRPTLRLPVLYRRKAPVPVKAGAGWTHNLSEEGACLELADRLAQASTLHLVFQTENGALELSAVVVWAAVIGEKGEGILHGVTFVALTPDKREALRAFLRASG